MNDALIFEEINHWGVITLNRPAALNALTLPMVKAMQTQLSLWLHKDLIQGVILKAAPGKAFCAGGDIRWLYETGLSNSPQNKEFFWHEYRLNHFIHSYNKPYVALMDGITMGGGVGIALHGKYPLATENFTFAMPETGIGFFPDIGASYLLARCPDNQGLYIGLTGVRLKSQDALKVGLIKYNVRSDNLSLVYEALLSIDLSSNAFEKVESCLASFPSPDHNVNSELNESPAFDSDSLEGILNSLEQSTDHRSKSMLSTLKTKSPLSLMITFAQLQKAKSQTLAQCLKDDFCLANHFMHDKDFYEGVRALLIDKDKSPLWNPSGIELVSKNKVQEYFNEEYGELELILNASS